MIHGAWKGPFKKVRQGLYGFRPRLFFVHGRNVDKLGLEPRTASKPCCAGPSNGAGGSAVVGLDPNAGLIAATAPSSPLDATGVYA